jgi:hypothetical protein
VIGERKLLVYVEIDEPRCSLSYGVGLCAAAIPTTGDARCFNTRFTCQDRANYAESVVTLRFAKPTDYLPVEIEAIPSIMGVSVSPGIISLGEDLGLRAELKVMLRDHRSSDTGPGGDPYLSTRSGNAFDKGTYWGKWRARVRYLRGQPIRLIIGEAGQPLASMETRHYVVEAVDGPNADGQVTIIAKDPLKLADGDRAQAPGLSRGYLQAAITDASASLTLAPGGVGAEYPASGFAAIGGAEIVSYTRSGDVLTITRAQLGTTAQAHEPEDRVQVVLQYVGGDPADIIRDLLVTYAGVDQSYIDLTDWKAETAAYLGRVFSANIAEPTDVNKLISELIEQAALAIWWDEIARKIKLRVLRQISTDAATFTTETITEGSFSLREQPNKRVSQVWFFYGQRNPLKKLDEEENYRSVAVGIDADAEADYGTPAIKKIFSRWVAAFGRSSAERSNDVILGRYRDPPRRFQWQLFRDQASDVVAGSGYQVEWWNLQDTDGLVSPVPIQITRMAPDSDGANINFEAEEANFARLDPIDLDNRAITIDTNTYNFNLRQAHDLIYPAPQSGDDFSLKVIVESGAIVGGTVLGSPAFDVGDWTGFGDVTIEVVNNGRIQGRGGGGGRGWSSDGDTPSTAGEAGSTAFYSRRAITLDNTNGEIWGGGGGGGGGGMSSWASNRESGGGGGGQGFAPGALGFAEGSAKLFTLATAGTTEAPGIGGNGANGTSNKGGNGGAPGQAGFKGTQVSASFPAKNGGAAGSAVDGNSFVTFTALGDIKGTRIN